MVDSLVAVHDFVQVFGHGNAHRGAGRAARAVPTPAEHPVVRTHPVTGRRSLYVNVAFTTRIKGLSPEESTQLLRYLYKQAARARAPVPLPLGAELHVRALGQPVRAALRRERLLPASVEIMSNVTIVGDRPR